MLEANKGKAPKLDGSSLRVGIVQSRFNAGITDGMLQSCLKELDALSVPADQITHVTVPGALEVPLALQMLAHAGKLDALIALGCVIRGETYHFELVANESAAGVTRVALDYRIPVANAILTCEDHSQAVMRQIEKARDAARVAVEMATLQGYYA